MSTQVFIYRKSSDNDSINKQSMPIHIERTGAACNARAKKQNNLSSFPSLSLSFFHGRGRKTLSGLNGTEGRIPLPRQVNPAGASERAFCARGDYRGSDVPVHECRRRDPLDLSIKEIKRKSHPGIPLPPLYTYSHVCIYVYV